MTKATPAHHLDDGARRTHEEIPCHDAETGEIIEPLASASQPEQAGAALPIVSPTAASPAAPVVAVLPRHDEDFEDLPDFLDRRKRPAWLKARAERGAAQ